MLLGPLGSCAHRAVSLGLVTGARGSGSPAFGEEAQGGSRADKGTKCPPVPVQVGGRALEM